MKRYTFTVQGKGSFPLDMLRYDKCWPANENAVELISNDGVRPAVDPRSIEFSSVQSPTRPRWQSFGWDVVEVRGYKV